MSGTIGLAIAYRILRDRHHRPEVIEEAINRATAECLHRQALSSFGRLWGPYERRSCCPSDLLASAKPRDLVRYDAHLMSPEHCERLFMETPQ